MVCQCFYPLWKQFSGVYLQLTVSQRVRWLCPVCFDQSHTVFLINAVAVIWNALWNNMIFSPASHRLMCASNRLAILKKKVCRCFSFLIVFGFLFFCSFWWYCKVCTQRIDDCYEYEVVVPSFLHNSFDLFAWKLTGSDKRRRPHFANDQFVSFGRSVAPAAASVWK